MATSVSKTQAKSLEDVHGSISTSHPGFFKRVFAFMGPAYLVSVGYIDPGNWATDLEGFISLRLRPWMRRLITRVIAIVPAMVVIALYGDKGTYRLLILSQVILSLQLPFAIIPLIHFTNDRVKMGATW